MTLLVLLSGLAAVDPVQGHIIGRCEVDDVSLVADERAQWPSAVAQEVHKVGMDLVKRNRALRITLSTALQRLQQLVHANLACFRARGRGGARVHDVPVGAAPRALWVVSFFSLFVCPCLFFCSWRIVFVLTCTMPDSAADTRHCVVVVALGFLCQGPQRLPVPCADGQWCRSH